MGKQKNPFRRLVDSEEGIRNFRSKYKIPPTVGLKYAAQGEWVDARQTGEVVIPMIAFIEGGMTIPMGSITRGYLNFFRLSPTQCAPNMFRILGSVDALNQRMDLKLTHHDVNWVYSLHRLADQDYYLKSRYPEVRLIQCLPTSNKNLKEDFLIFSGEWHDGLPCPTVEGTPGGCEVIDLCYLAREHILLTFIIFMFYNFNSRINGFADRRYTKPNLRLVNKASLDRLLKAEIYVNEADGQLRAAHLILGYTPLSFGF